MGRKMLIKEASVTLGLSQNALRNAIRRGDVPFLMIGNRYVVDVELVEKTLERTSLENMLAKQNIAKEYRLRKVSE
ncbi:hypothetical protein ACHAL6_11655 [Proteiniclasticum sp. C24MP]|uniref:hypothetical protein n=1 Tax=Proteiniclasticum sp. C24MP TaxID=3374101 RepID=UPI003754FC3C